MSIVNHVGRLTCIFGKEVEERILISGRSVILRNFRHVLTRFPVNVTSETKRSGQFSQHAVTISCSFTNRKKLR